ncbi:hypothetical protein CRENBAI_015017 [Crenichthys baileyi]|uniref:Uncharacterized protein n=1 Tax=Crenichthys baileyi TaxID=28760 RepID=A0AAV9SRZ6_9TELE
METKWKRYKPGTRVKSSLWGSGTLRSAEGYSGVLGVRRVEVARKNRLAWVQMSIHPACFSQEKEPIINMDFIKVEERQISDVICLTSEDDEDVVYMSTEQKSEQRETSVKEEEFQLQQIQRVEPAESAVDKLIPGNDLVNFIRTNFYDDVYSADPKDVAQAVTDRPYCVYLYVGVELGGGQSTSVLLIGYFDESSCESVVKLLHTLQMSTDSTDPQHSTNMDTDAMARVADSDAWLLVEALRKYELPLSNLVAFYCSTPKPGLSRVFVSRLQAFSPKFLSLCSIPGIAERTCHAGLMASFSHGGGPIEHPAIL